MNSSDTRLLEFITRLTYNIEGLPGQLKLYLSQFLTFHFSKTLSRNQIEDVENKKASARYQNREEIQAASLSFSPEEKRWCVASLQLLQVEAEKIDNRIVSRRIGIILKDLTYVFELGGQEEKITEERKRIEQEIHQFQNRPIVKIPTNIWPLTVDFTIRCVILLSFSYLSIDKGLLTALNVFVIPIIILITASLVGRRQKRANLQLLDNYGGAQLYKMEYHVTTGQYTWLALFLGTSVFISYLLPGQLHVFALFGLTFYYLMYLRFFRVGRILENDLVKQLENKTLDTELLNVDENDEVIVALETKLNSSTSRLEAYVLESALFGALTFSGFLQIMATDLVSFQDLENFASYIFTTAQAFIHFDWDTFEAGLVSLGNKKSLFCLVSVESLICSIFFLAVIASRLRFSDIADKVRTAINLAKAYNVKEEAMHGEQEITGKKISRLDVLTAKVNAQLHKATLVLEEITPVMQYMQYFRNAGILVFLVILISSSLFITSVLGWTFLVLVLATYFYFNRSTLNNQFKALFLSFRIQFVKQGYWLFGFALLPSFFAYFLGIFFQLQYTDSLFALSYWLIGLYVFAWLILAAHVDEQFGEIEDVQNLSRQSRWKIVKNTMAVVILIYETGMAFKELHFTGADELMVISISAIAILMYFVGYYLTKVRWVGIIGGGILAVSSMGILFKILHLTGGNIMLTVAFFAFAIFIPVIIWKRKIFHQLLVRFCVVGFLICIWYSPMFNGLTMRLQAAYIHQTTDIDKLLDVIEGSDTEMLMKEGEKATDREMEKCDWYLNEYGTRHGFTFIHRTLVMRYHYLGIAVLDVENAKPKIDSTALPSAQKVAHEVFKILTLFKYEELPSHFMQPMSSIPPIEMEAAILLAMRRNEEAIQSLEKVIQFISDEEDKKAIRQRIEKIKSSQ